MSEDLLLKSGAIIRELREKLATLQKGQSEPIAIVGMACRFPGNVNDLDAFWQLIESGGVTAGELASERLLLEGGGMPRLGSFLKDVDQFDAAFFDIPEREAIRMDPQQRIFLEVAWQALEDAGQTREGLEGSETGVFVGVHNHSNDYFGMQSADVSQIDAYTALGTGHDVIAGRLAYWLDLRGPASAINTACSSSLVAVHLACQSLRESDCQMAVVGGVNLQLTPVSTICGARLNMLSADGRCKAFDAAADGFGRGEGCGVVVLKRLSAAQRDGDRVDAVLLGSAINQDGRTNGLTAPNGLAQQRLIERTLTRAERKAQDVGYVEAHGTGTPLGDPIEVEALSEVYGRNGSFRCGLGSVKANIGHLEAAAGVASLIKTVLVLQHGVVPPVAGLRLRSSHLDEMDQTRLFLPQTATPWPQQSGKRLAAVSAFGWSGTNAHLLVEQGPEVTPAKATREEFVLALSAATPESLRRLAKSYEQALRRLPEEKLASFCYTANARRTRHAHRLTVSGQNARSLADQLSSGEGNSDPPVSYGERFPLVSLPPYTYDRQRYWLDLPRADAGAPDDWFYQTRWHESRDGFHVSDLADAAQQKLLQQSSVTLSDSRGESAGSMEEEAVQWMQAALIELGLPKLPGEVFSASVRGHARLFDRILSTMVDAGVLREQNGRLETTGKLLPAPPAEARGEISIERQVLRKCGRALADVLLGRRDALELLFDGSGPGAERLYKDSPAMRLAHALLRQVFGETVDAISPYVPVDVLEIGAGTGAATAALLEAQTRPIDEYRFTDVARTMVAKAESDFAQYPFLRGAVLDIEAESPTRPAKTYDIVIAANVVHATASIRHSLAHIESLLKPSGVLLLLETTAARHWVDLVFGLTPGWWRFSDADLREKDALLSSSRWVDVLRERFGDVAAVPLPPGAGDVVEQTVLIARKAPAVSTVGRWGILGDRTGVAEKLASAIEKRGGEAVLVESEMDGCAGVVFLRALDSDDPAEVVASATDALRRFSSKLWIVTRGAQPVGPDASASALAQSTLWGLGATAAIEMSTRWGGLIDLDPKEHLDEAERLVDQIVSSSGESRVAFRNGKRLLPRFERMAAPPKKQLQMRADAAYLLTGATGAVAPGVARWLVDRGARFLVLVARGAANSALCEELRGRGVTVHSVVCDIGNESDVEQLFARFGDHWPELKGIVHAAAQIEAVPLAELKRSDIDAAFRAKVSGTLALERWSKNADFFVCFSSAAASLGARDRAHYGAANAFVNAVAAAGVNHAPAPISIEWGSWENQASGSEAERELIKRSGFDTMPTARAADAMERLIAARVTQATVAKLDWAVLKSALELHGQGRFVSAMGRPVQSAITQPPPDREPSLDRRERARELIETEMRRLLGMPENSPIDHERGFFEMGMDSLMSVELKNRLEAALGRSLPGTLTLNYPTIAALADFLEPPLESSEAPTQPSDYGPIAALSQQETLDALAQELQLLGGKL